MNSTSGNLLSIDDDFNNQKSCSIKQNFATGLTFYCSRLLKITQAGLHSARARGRKGGRPKGMSQSAIEKAAIAEALYKNGSIPVKKIAEQLGISKTTLYLYLRHRNVNIGEKIKML